jgi:hypothetical protein
MKASLFFLVCLVLVQSLLALVLVKESGALVPENTPEVVAARELHLSAVAAAEESERQASKLSLKVGTGTGISGGHFNIGRR